MNEITIPMADDFHLHLRQGNMLRQVVPLVSGGGVGRCVVMPNINPSVKSTDEALNYRSALRAVEPKLDYLMTLYLHPDLTPAEIKQAADAGIFGIKCYPRGVTTNSENGVEDLLEYGDIFRVMEEVGLPLLIHGEVPTNHALDICILNAEERFLPELEKLHRTFPKLKIVLEHVTTAAAVECIKSLGNSVAATVTLHHLVLTVDDWAGNHHNYCKPVAKYPHDRAALQQIIREGHPRFFFGSDSAPHPRSRKQGATISAGIFSSPILLPALADLFENIASLDKLAGFTSGHGCRFHGLVPTNKTVTLIREPWKIPDCYGNIVPLMAGKVINWKIKT